MSKLRNVGALVAILIAGLVLPDLLWAEIRTEGSCGPPPPPRPGNRASAEGFAPLPLPVTPQRRSEKKKPPEPPVIITKIKWGDVRDWATDQNDVNNLLVWMKTKLKLNFTYDERKIGELVFDPQRMPALYRTGHFAFSFTAQQRASLRKYAINGGFIIFDTCCGRKAFADSVRKELSLIFPETKLRLLSADHPIFHCYYDIDKVRLSAGAGGGEIPPPLYGINIGCRTAVVFSPYDMSCGWDMHQHADAKAIKAEDALRLGANLIAYSTATKSMGVSLSESKIYIDADSTKWDKFRVAQIKHQGDWNPDPAALSVLLDTISAATNVKISFDRKDMNLTDPNIGSYPFLYMTGHYSFKLSDEEATVLKRYLQNGGFLFADACCGRQAFDVAFRREMKKVLPEQSLKLIPADHAIYRQPTKITAVQYTPAAQIKMRPTTTTPMLEGISIDGHLAVVYSKYDLGCGWELKPHPYGVGYEARSAISLGINTVLYSITH